MRTNAQRHGKNFGATTPRKPTAFSLEKCLPAFSTRIDVVANNLANAETTAFKRSRVNFEDLYYLALKQPGTTAANGDVSPAGIYVGLGVKVSNTQVDTEQGSMEN